VWSPSLIVLQPTPYCNINCEYCYLHARNDRRLMSREVVDAVRDKIISRLSPDCAPAVVWHAGEPTVAPLSWYEYAHDRLRSAAPRKTTFLLQSNGVSIPDRWIEFLRRTDTQIGLSIDGPQCFHDARRKTKAGGPTWSLVMRTLGRLQAAGLDPRVISVLHPACLSAPREYYEFYRANNITHVSFSIDEAEGANRTSSFDGFDYKPKMVDFIQHLLNLAYADGYTLYIREVERIAHILTTGEPAANEQVEPWQVIVVAANGDVTSFSPEFMEITSARHNNFCFGNILRDEFEDLAENPFFTRIRDEIGLGVELCRKSCAYFGLCGGGAPVNKMFENKSLASGETSFCRLSIQAPADALIQFLSDKAALGRAQTACT
jgi:uncharacterized protein